MRTRVLTNPSNDVRDEIDKVNRAAASVRHEQSIGIVDGGLVDSMAELAIDKLFDSEIDVPINESKPSHDDQMDTDEVLEPSDHSLTEEDIIRLISSLRENVKNKRGKWQTENPDSFKQKCRSAKCIDRNLTKQEIIVCLDVISTVPGKVSYSKRWEKSQLVNVLSNVLGDKSQIPSRRCLKVLSLKVLCQKRVRQFPKHILNVVYAEHIFPDRLEEWKNGATFSDTVRISGLNKPEAWYCQPEYIQDLGISMFALIDVEHILVNTRVKVCSTGMPAAGIKRDAWVRVARENRTNKTGLSTALVEDLVDKQRCSYALKTFSHEVELEMLKNGDHNEAELCNLIRSFYMAEDEPGICAQERCERRLRLRNWLLNGVSFNQFPPPGLHVKDIPVVLFEAMLANIDRRIQLIPFVSKGTFCVRALGSQENENIFGSFQDIDPRGQGVIAPDDIPIALSSACEVLHAKMNPNKWVETISEHTWLWVTPYLCS